VFAYEFLKHHGLQIPNFRSSELWEDQIFTCTVNGLQPLDLILLNHNDSAWGAHVAVYLGEGLVLHLSKDNGYPKIENLQELQQTPKYKFYIGAKRILVEAIRMIEQH
jgi:hypothetical protein